jgi:competence protein ComEA
MSAAPTPAPAQPGSSPWPRAAQLAAALLLGAALTLLGIHACGYLRWGTRPMDVDPGGLPAYRIDLNRADRAKLLQLPGVGPRLADRIEEYRRDNGGFRSVDDLRHVRGIGPATVARLRAWVCVGDAADEPDGGSVATRSKPPKQPETETRKSATGYDSIDLNKATVEELRKLPGIGPKLSQAIVEQRDKAPFQSVDDLRRVHGIGPKTLERLRPYVTVGSDRARVAARE